MANELRALDQAMDDLMVSLRQASPEARMDRAGKASYALRALVHAFAARIEALETKTAKLGT